VNEMKEAENKYTDSDHRLLFRKL